MKKFLKQGFSLIEILTVIAILLIILGVVLFSFSNFRNQQLLKNNTEDIVYLLKEARTNSIASLDSSEYGVYFNTNQIILFKGTTYLLNNNEFEVFNLNNSISIVSLNLSNNADQVYFNRLNGLPSASGDIVITNGQISKTISILGTGIIEVN